MIHDHELHHHGAIEIKYEHSEIGDTLLLVGRDVQSKCNLSIPVNHIYYDP